MIVQRRLDVRRTLRFVAPLIAVLLAYDIAVTALYMVFGMHWLALEGVPLSVLGTPIALVVTLRNNAAFNRWWEARTLWGAVVNNSRSLARGVLIFIEDPALRTQLIRAQVAFALALRCHLLRIPAGEALATYLPAEDIVPAGVANVPAAVQMQMGRTMARALRDGRLGERGAVALDRTLSELANAMGGLERIKNTPMPRQYNHIPKLFTRALCILLPLALVKELQWSTPAASTVIGFMFLSLDQIGRNLEDPFEGTNHDVPMMAIGRVIEIDLLQTMGVADVPGPVQPVDGVLW